VNTPHQPRTLGSIRRLLLFAGLVVLGSGISAAFAAWSTAGTGTGSAVVGTLASPTAVTASATYSTVDLSWSGVTAPQGSIDGYVVTRSDGGAPSAACGTSLTGSNYLAAGVTSCTDTAVPNGQYTYVVTAVYRTWTAASSPSNAVTVSGDPNAPSQAVTLTNATGAALVGATIYFRSSSPGSFTLANAVSDGQSGPAASTFPAVGTPGWTHAVETVTTGTGANPITYTSSPFSWTAGASTPSSLTVVGRDRAGNTANTTLSFASDTSGPTGGALTVNGTGASAGGTTSNARTAFTIGVRTDYSSDAGAGVGSSVLTRETAPYTANSCGAFGSPITVTGAPAQTGLTTGCYRYTLTGTDLVGNTSAISTVVRYDASGPTQAVNLTSPSGAFLAGASLYVRTTVAGSFVLKSAVSDNESGPASVAFPAVTTAGWTHPAQTVTIGSGSAPTVSYSSSTYSWTAAAGLPPATTLTAADGIGNTGTTSLTFVRDTTVPATGALTVNGTAASGAGTTSFNRTGSFAISRVDYTDAGSGIMSSVLTVEQATLTGNVCGTYGAPTTVAGAPAQSGLATGCYRYILTGTDNVGNTAGRATTVKVDRESPISGQLTVNGTGATAGGTTSAANTAFPIDLRTDYSDVASGIASSTLQRSTATLSGNTCGTFGAATTLTGAPAQTGLATGCYRYVLTGTDRAGNTASLTSTVKYDAALPTGGALTVNGTAASGAGSTSTSTSGSFAIARTDYVDANSGLASSTLTREFATLTGTTCGSYGSPSTIVGAPTQAGLAPGCYRYRLIGTDNNGNTTSISTVVQQRVVVSAVALSNGTGTAGRIDAGDRIDITFSDVLAVSSICATWSGNASNQTLGGDNNVSVTLTNGGAGNDTVTFGATSCTLNVGSINLGSTAYTTANVTFRGAGVNASTVDWNVVTKTLRITLGAASGAGAATVTSSAPIVTPSGALLNPDAVAVGGTYTSPNSRQF
jgi:hypothetical protein